jgi:ubiquinone/menaquinone biosynthesis C-methylase UbiE
VDFINADVRHLPLRDNAFHGVLIVDVLHHLDRLPSLHSLRRLLRPGGRLLIIDLPGAHPIKFVMRKIAARVDVSALGYGQSFAFFTPNMLKSALLSAGFEVLSEFKREYFLGIVHLFLLFFPFMTRPLRGAVLLSLQDVEESFAKIPLVSSACVCVVLVCRWNPDEAG